MLRKIINGEFESISKKYSRELRNIVYSCLTKNFNKRPSCSELIAHPVFQAKANLWKIRLPFKTNPEKPPPAKKEEVAASENRLKRGNKIVPNL